MASFSQRSQGGQPIQEVALGLGEPEGPQGTHQEGGGSGKGADGGPAVVGMGQRPGSDGGCRPVAGVPAVTGCSRRHPAMDLTLPLLVPPRRGPEGPVMCTPPSPRAPGEVKAEAGEGGSRASPAWGSSCDLSWSPALRGSASASLSGQPGPDFLSGHEGPPGSLASVQAQARLPGSLLLCAWLCSQEA